MKKSIKETENDLAVLLTWSECHPITKGLQVQFPVRVYT